jgi:hypothetical protein
MWPLGFLAGVVGAWWVTRSLLRLVDFDRPLRYWRQAAGDELRGKRLADASRSVRVEMRWRNAVVPDR